MTQLMNRAKGLAKNDAEDLYQETMMRFYDHYSNFQGTDEERLKLMYTIMKNCFLDRQKKRKETSFTDLAQEDENGEYLTWEPAGTSYDVNYDDVYEIIFALPCKLRDAANLVFLQGLSYQRTADVLQITVSAVTSRLARAKYLIRRNLEF